jgi:hypothetical protein
MENLEINQHDSPGIRWAKKFTQGRYYWYQYQKINGYAFRANESGLKKLSKNIDIEVSTLREYINIFLEA